MFLEISHALYPTQMTVADLEGAKGPCPPQRIMVSASDVAVDKRLYVNRQSESVVKSAYVSVTTDRTLDCIVRTLNYVFLNP